MKKLILFTISLCCLNLVSKAQEDFEYGKVTQAEINMQRYDKDTAAHAVVLNEFGRTNINATNDEHIRLIYQYHVKIKIFDNEGINKGNIEVPLYNNDGYDEFEEINSIKGITTYVDDNGQIQTAELDGNKIYRTKENKHYTLVKFAMPAVRKGCIIDYTYTTFSPFWENFHNWKFQWDIPKVYSEYDVHIPGFWNFNASIRGAFKLTKNTAEIETGCFSFAGAKSDCSHFVYGMKDIPAFIEEADMTSANNFISGIYYELVDYTDLQGGGKHVIAKEWKDVDLELKHSDYFGNQLKKKDFFKDKLAPVIAGKTDSLDKAKAVYEYIKQNIKWNNFYGTGSEDGVRKVFENHTGSVADINLALVTALSAAGLNANAVILSTRDNGIVGRLYPAVGDFNYVIAQVTIGGKSYLLDATEPLLSFGMLPLRCLNDQGRVMCLDKPSYWIDLNTSQKESNTFLLDLILQPDGKIKGTMIHYSLGYEAYEKRKEIKKFNSVDEYVESLDEKSSKFKILNSEVTNLDSLDLPMSEKYSVEIKEFNNMDHERLLFNPYLWDRITVNPFKLADRTYPVDCGMPSATRFTLNMQLPDDYTIESVPQDIGVQLPNNGGSFIVHFEVNGNTFTFSYVTKLNRSVYYPEEYPYLKELFNKIILAEKAELIFKKK
jgi:hypothetical protein